METLVATENTTLTALDRCDACGAQAYVRAGFTTGELLFCAHHAREYAPALTEAAQVIQDETERLETEK